MFICYFIATVFLGGADVLCNVILQSIFLLFWNRSHFSNIKICAGVINFCII